MGKLLLPACALLFLVPSASQSKSLKLVRNGVSLYTIVRAKDAPPTEQYAAEELQGFLKQISGAYLPLVTDETIPSTPMICVGASKATESLGISIPLEELGQEGFIMKTSFPHLIIAGGKKRGTLYGCYQFLEEELGCRWFAPGCSKIPQNKTLRIWALDEKVIPRLEYRATDYPNSRDPDWAVRNRMNGHLQTLDEKRGGNVTYHHFVHTFNSLIPPETYFDSHPEYFSLVSGQRVKERSQLCLTHPDVLALGKEKVKQWITEAPGAAIYSVSQNDWFNYCQCEACTKLAEEEGGQSGPLLRYLNALAESIEKDYPDKALDTLAYQYTRKPPKTTVPKPNVIIRLCTIECCFSHSLASDPFNAKFKEDIEGWNKICDRLYIWDYVINYAHSISPFPNLYVLKPNINFFIENGVKGIYEEANYYSRGGEFAELRTYILAKTLWDPSYDTDKAIDEFLAAYYGPAASPIREYIDLLHGRIAKLPKTHMGIYSPPRLGYLNDKVLAEAARLFSEAEAEVKDNPELSHRVAVAKMPILYASITLAGQQMVRDKDRILVKGDVASQVEEFERIARKEGVTSIRESGPVDDWLTQVKQKRWEIPLVTLRDGDLLAEVLPGFGGKVVRLRDVKAGKDFLWPSEKAGLFDPEKGGYEEYSGTGYRSPGWREEYAVSEKSDNALTLTATLENGLTLTRTLSLDGQEKSLKIQSTLENKGTEPRQASLRVHPEWMAQNLKGASLRLKTQDGWAEWDLGQKAKASPENEETVSKECLSQGEWVFTDGGSTLGILNQFDPQAVSQGLVNWSVQGQRLNLELFAPEVSLAPGEKQTLNHCYRIVKD